MAGELLKDFEKKKKFARQKLEWLLPISSTRSRPSFEVVTSRMPGAQGKGAVRATWAVGGLVSRHPYGVAT